MYPWSSRCGLTKRAETKKKREKRREKGGEKVKRREERERKRERRIFARRGTGVWSRG